MNFSEFVQILFPIIGAGNNTSTFTKTIFESILEEKDQEIIHALRDSTFKSYYNGKNGIKVTAKKITACLEPIEFEEYLNSFPDPTIQLLCEAFKTYISEITLHNASSKIAELFTSIIVKAASTNKKSTQKSADKENLLNEDIEYVNAEVVDDNVQSDNSKEKLDNNTTIIKQQTNVVQTGNNSVSLVNNSNITINL